MLNFKTILKKPLTCEVKRSPDCEGTITVINHTKDGKRICEACTNL